MRRVKGEWAEWRTRGLREEKRERGGGETCEEMREEDAIRRGEHVQLWVEGGRS